MNKLYYIVCEERGSPLFEGRCQARTRGAAIKYLKEQLGRSSLSGLVFSITEIPVPLIREIVKAVLENRPIADAPIVGDAPTTPDKPEAPQRYDAFERANEHPVEDHELGDKPDDKDAFDNALANNETPPPALMRKPRKVEPDTHDWDAITAHYLECRSPKQTAEHFGIKLTTLTGRIKREGWSKQKGVRK